MKFKKIILSVATVSVAMFTTFSTSTVQAKEWPHEKNMRVVVPYPGGGTVDILGRLIAKKLSEKLDITTYVENISGGASIPATLNVLKEKADGYHLFLASDTTLNINKHLLKNPRYDGDKDLAVVTVLNTMPHWMIVEKDSPFNSFEELRDYVKENPGKAAISVNGVGGSAYLALDKWKKDNELDFEIIPYRGSPPAVVDLIAGVTTAHIDVVGSSIGYYKTNDKDSSKVKPLAMLQEENLDILPDIPTLSKNDPEDLTILGSQSLVVKAGTPKEIIQKIYEVVKEGAQEEDFVKQFETFGLMPVLTSPEESQEFVHKETDRYKKLIEISGIPKQ